VIPQFDEMATPNIEDNLFYSAIKIMPASSDATKRFNSKVYRNDQ
jgi:hypothetical protein